MKTRSESTSKPKDNRSAQHTRRSRQSGSSPEAYDCPREQMIAEAAYFRAEQRGFMPGNELSDWLQAEAEVQHISDRSQ